MERKRLIQEGLAKRAFPPRVAYPELSNRWDELSPLAGLFDHPVVVWVPEATCRGQKPACVVSGCRCTLRVKEYRQRVVEDMEGEQVLLYIKYQCAGSARTCFSTISPEYLHSNVEAMVYFSYILGSKSGYSKPLLDMIHDGMMSPNGLSSTVANIRRRRQARYYKLYTLFADRVRRLRLSNPDYVAPTPPTVAEYCASNAVVDTKVLTAVWMETTAMYGPLCELLMQKMSVRKVLRVDHSAKFCKQLKVWDGPGQHTSISDAKLLLLIQNEVGQIVGRRLTRSENNEETAALLDAVKPTLKPEDDEAIYLVSDNANGVRGMVQHTFGGRVDVKQDPFHVMMRVKEKLESAAKKKWISKELMSAMYTVERRLRPPEEMEKEFRRVASLVSPSDLSCSEATWQGCIDSNAAQIKNGDLFVENNDYAEAHTTTRVVATSHLEGFHSGLKNLLNRALSVEVGLRILDVFIVQHNLRIGAKFGSNSAFGDFNFVSLAQAAILSRGTVQDTHQLAFVSHILSGQMPHPQYRPGSSLDFEFSE